MSQRQDDRGDRERDRGGRDWDPERAARSTVVPSSIRMNEYFVPRDGIDREVITADICRYLGRDALVRPGYRVDQRTGRSEPGYFITAYRNLTTAMIEDLKADSERWEAERASRNTPNVQHYRSSMVHQSRQHYGPTVAVPGSASTFAPPANNNSPGVSVNNYDSTSPYGQPGQQYAATPATTYPSSSSAGYATPYHASNAQFQQDNHYYAGADLQATEHRPSQSSRGIPQSNSGVPLQGSGYGQPADPYYSSRGAPVVYRGDSGYAKSTTPYPNSMPPPSREPRERDYPESSDTRDPRESRRTRNEEPSLRSNEYSRHH